MISRSEYERGFTLPKPAARYASGKLPNILANVVAEAHSPSLLCEIDVPAGRFSSEFLSERF